MSNVYAPQFRIEANAPTSLRNQPHRRRIWWTNSFGDHERAAALQRLAEERLEHPDLLIMLHERQPDGTWIVIEPRLDHTWRCYTANRYGKKRLYGPVFDAETVEGARVRLAQWKIENPGERHGIERLDDDLAWRDLLPVDPTF